jgi:hypothetical protein
MKSSKFRQSASGEIPMPNRGMEIPASLTRTLCSGRPKLDVSLWLGIWCLAIFQATNAVAQSNNIDWYKLSGGGGTSSNGQYTLSGTIGQQDAGGPMTGGNYSLTGGFWALYAVQTPGAPVLSIARTTTNTVAIFWPSPSTGWMLQQNTSGISSVNWSNVLDTPLDDGTNRTVIVNPPSGRRFYRLFKS